DGAGNALADQGQTPFHGLASRTSWNSGRHVRHCRASARRLRLSISDQMATRRLVSLRDGDGHVRAKMPKILGDIAGLGWNFLCSRLIGQGEGANAWVTGFVESK